MPARIAIRILPPPVSARSGRGILTAMADPAGPRLAVFCRACGYPSSSYVAGKIIRDGDEDDGPYELSLIQCEFCDSPSLVRQDEASEAAQSRCGPAGSELCMRRSLVEYAMV
jgi:hypothetical protein